MRLRTVRSGFLRRFAEENEEKNEHRDGAAARNHPDGPPVMVSESGNFGEGMHREHFAGQHRAHECPDTPKDEGNKTLASASDPFVRFVIHVELARDEEEIIADAVQEDRGEDQGCLELPNASVGV